MTDLDDDLRPAQGILFSLLLSAPFWLILWWAL